MVAVSQEIFLFNVSRGRREGPWKEGLLTRFGKSATLARDLFPAPHRCCAQRRRIRAVWGQTASVIRPKVFSPGAIEPEDGGDDDDSQVAGHSTYRTASLPKRNVLT